MNLPKWIFASAVGFVVVYLLDFLFHGILFADLYGRTLGLWRPESQMRDLMWLMMINQALFSGAFVWFYAKGYEEGKTGIGQGFRFGLYVGVLLAALNSTSWYVVMPIPYILNFGWAASAFITSILLGMITGLIYKPK